MEGQGGVNKVKQLGNIFVTPAVGKPRPSNEVKNGKWIVNKLAVKYILMGDHSVLLFIVIIIIMIILLYLLARHYTRQSNPKIQPHKKNPHLPVVAPNSKSRSSDRVVTIPHLRFLNTGLYTQTCISTLTA